MTVGPPPGLPVPLPVNRSVFPFTYPVERPFQPSMPPMGDAFRRENGRQRFAVLGDAGTGLGGQAAVSAQMSNARRFLPFNTVLVLGDNVYRHGEPHRFNDCIAKPYQALFQQGVTFRPVLGNHDVNAGYGDWQLAYWGVPPFYSFKLGAPGQDVEFFAIDTTVLAPGLSGCYESNPETAWRKAAIQMRWLTQALQASRSGMKVVYGHYPLYSTATKPARLQEEMRMRQALEPLLRRYGVDLYLAGHEHHYEKPHPVGGVYYAVSGAGGMLDTPLKGPPDGHGVLKRLHFMLFEMTPQGLAYQTLSERGEKLDEGCIPRKTPVNPFAWTRAGLASPFASAALSGPRF